MVILPTIVLFMELAAGCRTPKDPNVQCIDAAVGEGGSWPTVPFGEVLGWEFDFQNSTGGREISIEPSMASGTKPVYVLGPFNGRGDGITTIKQDFACSYDSKVNVKYRLYSCGNLENSEAPDAANSLDWSALNFNGDQQPSTRREGNAGDAVELNPSTRLNEIVRAMNGGNGCEGEGTGNDIWTFTDIEINGDELPEVDEYDTFTLALTGRLSFREEWIAFGGIQVICIANDRDEDKVADTIDNCPDVKNPYQKDLDHDNKGDECDDDIDGDWVPNAADKCPTKPGPAIYYGCPPEDKQYGKGGRGDEGKGQGGYRYDTGNRDGGKGDKGYSYRGGNGGRYGGNNNKGDEGPGGRYWYDGGNRDTGRGGGGGGRGRYGYGSGSNSGSGSGSYSSSDSSSRGRRTRNRYERDDKDERRQIEEMLRKLEYEYRGSSKY